MADSIIIDIRDKRWKVQLKPHEKTVRDVCEAALGKKKGEITVVLADDEFIHELNATYRGKNYPTNVLSFAGEGKHLGDLVLAYETIAKEAKVQGKTFQDHTAHLLVHGVLHLMGHDHMGAKEAEAMESKEIKILEKLGVSNPYL